MLGKWSLLAMFAFGLWCPGTVMADDGRYYLVAHRDLRKCASPLCGGVYVKEVNKPFTRCADGKLRPECYVGTVDYPVFERAPDGREDFPGEFTAGFGLAKGKLQNRASPFGVAVGALIVAEAWRAQALKPPSGRFYRVEDAGIRCITFPCPSLGERLPDGGRTAFIAGVDLEASGAEADRVEAGRNRLYVDGLLVAGRHVETPGPAGSGRTLVASEFYLRELTMSAAGDRNCGANPGVECPRGQFCDPGPLGCAAAGFEGVCEVRPEICTLEHNPVCGCDGVTYGNDCRRRGAGVGLAHKGECKTGEALQQ